MSDKDIYKECAATSTATLEEYITNPCIPKNENEWWASREIERLRKYEKLVQFIASDYWELSHDKIRWLYTEYKTKSRELIEEDNE